MFAEVGEETPANTTHLGEFVDISGTTWRKCTNNILGRGASGTVSTVLSSSGKLAAVKEIPFNKSVDENDLYTEIEALSHLHHENIVSYISSAIVSESTMGIVMELVATGSLQDLLSNFGTLDAKAALHYSCDILAGLDYLHRKGLVHSDIKPSNVLVTSDGVAKLVDFGSVSKIGAHGETTRGTETFFSPEAVLNSTCTPASDIWSFGITLLILVTKSNPWAHTSLTGMRLSIAIGNDETMRPHIPTTVDSKIAMLVDKCCQRDPTKRPHALDLLNLCLV